MGTTADKLTYLNNTKVLLKDRLNSLGAEITSVTTFRNYLTWLDTFYGEVSDKTGLSINGVVGRTSQDSTTGKNLFEAPNSPSDYYKVTYSKINNNSISMSYNQSSSSNSSSYARIDFDISKLKPNTTYTLSKIQNVSGTSFNGIGSLRTRLNGVNGAVVNANSITFTTPSVLENVGIYFYAAYQNTTTGNATITFDNIQLEENSTSTSYEPYTGGQPSPSQNYPQNINTLTGNVIYTITGDNTETFTIPLGDIELCEINTYKDSIYSNDSKFYLKKETAKINSYNGETISTDYKSTTGGLDTGATIYYGTTVATTEITSSNYPELYAALKEIEDYLVAYKINKEFILGYSSPTIEY